MTLNSVGPEAPTRTVVRDLLCPSDGLGSDTATYAPLGVETGSYNRSNYLAFFGDENFGAAFSGRGRKAAFGVNYGARLADITNGASQTMIFGEYLTGLPPQQAPSDLRGVHWVDVPGMSQLYTQ